MSLFTLKKHCQFFRIFIQLRNFYPEIPSSPSDHQHRVFLKLFPGFRYNEYWSPDKEKKYQGDAVLPVKNRVACRVGSVVAQTDDGVKEQPKNEGQRHHAGKDKQEPRPVQPGIADAYRSDLAVDELRVRLFKSDIITPDHDVRTAAEGFVHKFVPAISNREAACGRQQLFVNNFVILSDGRHLHHVVRFGRIMGKLGACPGGDQVGIGFVPRIQGYVAVIKVPASRRFMVDQDRVFRKINFRQPDVCTIIIGA